MISTAWIGIGMSEGIETASFVRFEKPAAHRFYELRVQQDLFGGHELWLVWGSTATRHGRSIVRPMPTAEEAGLLDAASRFRSTFRSLIRPASSHSFDRARRPR
jgi:predicted DNA-binding WGR domain protein